MKTPYNNTLPELASEKRKNQSTCDLPNKTVESDPNTSHGRNSGHPPGAPLDLGGPN